jgi:uncharacterized protein YcbK (DUF882 family)
MRLSATLPALALVLASSAVAHADVQHTVGRGHTIDAIANRYKVSPKAIMDANHLKNAKRLQVGDVLTIPGVKEKSDAKGKVAKTEKDKDRDKDRHHKSDPESFKMKPKTPGVVHLKRIATNEESDIRVADRKGRVAPTTLKSFEKLMRAPGGQAHPIEPRLIALLKIVSDHFGSRKIEVVSGFRPYTPTQYTPHSNHNHGKAIDFRVVGVPNEAVRDFCRTLKNTGCGYYPNSVFVHMDAREKPTFWIDYSKPGEPPRYNAPNLDADEGTSDVHDETDKDNKDSKDKKGDAPSDAPPESPSSDSPPSPSTTGSSENPK